MFAKIFGGVVLASVLAVTGFSLSSSRTDCCGADRDCCNPPQACCFDDCCAANLSCCETGEACCLSK